MVTSEVIRFRKSYLNSAIGLSNVNYLSLTLIYKAVTLQTTGDTSTWR